MSQAAGVLDLTFKAGADLEDKKYHFVKLNGDGDVVVSDSDKAVSIGILQSETDTKGDTIDPEGQAVRVRLIGTSKLVMGEKCPVEGPFGGYNKGALIVSDDNGEGKVAADPAEHIGAIALEAADGADEIIEVLVTHMYAPASV